MPETEVLLQTRGLKKYFPIHGGLLHAVDGIDLDLQTGQTLGIVGESGCGKSTLGRVILRLIEPTAGSILLQGRDITHLSKKQMRGIRTVMHIIFQDPNASLNPRLSVWELIGEPMIVNKMYPKRQQVYQRVRELMEIVGLAERLENAYPHELDGGRRQRIGIARALAVNPQFIVCDEPVSALDVSIQAQILNLLMDLQEELGLSYIFITHDLSVVKHISNTIAVMYLGKFVEVAPYGEIFARPRHPYTQALMEAIPVPDLSSRGQEIKLIRGELASPVNPRPGCRFAPRCDQARPCCAEQDPPLAEISPGHLLACFNCSTQ